MKKFFNHTKRPIEDWDDTQDNSFDWDQVSEEAYTEEEEYYAEGEEVYTEAGEYYAEGEEAYPEEGEYYAEGEEACPEEGEYYAEEEEAYPEEGEYYAEGEEAYPEEGEYYAEGEEAYPEAGEYYAEGEEAYPEAGEYYAEGEEAYPEAGEYYAEDEESYEEETTYVRKAAGSRPTARKGHSGNKQNGNNNVFLLLWNKFLHMGAMDRIITATGVAVLVLALVTSGLYVSTKMVENQVSEFVSVGNQLSGIEMIGEKGLLAVANAQQARIAAASVVAEEEEKEYEEADLSKEVTVSLSLTSVEKDLKIKFTNKKTGKLIANVPFVVTVTTPAGKTETWSDEDKDGVIYKSDITPGSYKVALNALTDAKYADYIIDTAAKAVDVKKNISYEKIDVSNEVKSEDEINASLEDTKKNETVVESTLKDTVAWVESTATVNTYTEVAKSTIPDPTTLAAGGRFLKMAATTTTLSETTKTLQTGGTFTLTAKCLADNVDVTGTVGGSWVSSNPAVASVSGTGSSATVTALAAGTATITFTANGTVSPGDAVSFTGTCTVTVSDVAGTVTVNTPNVTAVPGVGTAVKATPAGFSAGRELVYSIASGNTGVATAVIDQAGNITITGVAAGSAAVTVTVNYKNGGAATAATTVINVTVAGNKTITLDKTAATVYISAPVVINATIANATTQTAVNAESSNTNVATVSVNGRAITITGVAAGSATITVKYTENGETVQATCAVTVKAHPKDDKTTQLKDASGNLLYVQEGDTYRLATYADYYTASKFFIKGDAKYTGWQTIDGKVYFFDANGKKMTGEQVIQGAKYNFASDGALVTGSGTMGIDVSKWNGTIDWNAVKNSGISYVIIRCGYRGSSQGTLVEDPKFVSNIKGATAAGLKVGVYFFTQAVNAVEAVEEASMVLGQVKNYKISYPIFLDVESSGGRADSIDRATRTAVCKAFCETIQNAGYTAGVYANKTWFTSKIDASALSAYKIWLAQYAATPTYTGRYDLWQYSSKGRVSGISGNVDLNQSYLGY